MNPIDILIFSAPSGAGKTTIVHHLLQKFPQLEFSISATSRAPRGKEQEGKDYYFLSVEEFRRRITNKEFVEWEEVYPDCFYGTLQSEVTRILDKKHIVVFDVDVKGGIRLKQLYGSRALCVFIQPLSIETLRQRLVMRKTESPEFIERRVKKADEELAYVEKFDITLINDKLEHALKEAENIVSEAVSRQKTI